MRTEKEIKKQIKINKKWAKKYEKYKERYPAAGWMAQTHYQKAAILEWVLGGKRGKNGNNI